MPSTSSSRDPKGRMIHFDEASHKYWTVRPDGRERLYTSVTTLCHLFVPPFDSDAVAGRVAEKRGVSKEEILTEWAEKRDYSCEFGTRVHETCEDVLLGREQFRNEPKSITEGDTFLSAKGAAARLKKSMTDIRVETILFDYELGLAGTADAIAVDRAGKTWIIDWKTNEKLQEENKFGETMLPPLDHLDNCNLNVYSLQLATYEFIMRRNGSLKDGEPVGRLVCWLRQYPAKMFVLPDRSDEVEMMVEAALDNGTLKRA